MKKLMWFLLALLMFTGAAMAEGVYEYEVVDGEAVIIKYRGEEGDITIPATLDGYPVTKIGSSAFAFIRIGHLYIPDGVTEIAEEAFRNTGARSVRLPEGLEVIRSHAFYATNFESVVLPDSLKRLEIMAFSGNKKLTALHLPDHMEYVEKGPVSVGVPVYCSVGSQTASHMGDIQFRDTQHAGMVFSWPAGSGLTVCDYTGDDAVVRVPEGVVALAPGAFEGAENVQSFVLPDTLKTIGYGAFSMCFSLKSISIPSSVHSIGEAAFGLCTSLTEFTLPATVKQIGNGLLQDCSSLRKVNLPEGMTQIPYSFFDCCSGLESVNIPSTVTAIGDYAFMACRALKSITIPATVTQIGSDAFHDASPVIRCYRGSAADAFAGSHGLTVEYIAPPRIPGDANDDGAADLFDALIVLQYDAGWDVSVNESNADVNADGFADLFDALLILQYDAGWDVELK